MKLQPIRRIGVYGCVLAGTLGVGLVQAQDTISQPPFARIVGRPMPAPLVDLSGQPSIPLVVDGKSGDTNDVVVVLNYANTTGIQAQLATPAGANPSPAALERAVVDAVNRKEAVISQNLLGAAHARHLMGTQRMSDADRLRGAELKAPREYMERYIMLRYPTVAAARAAVKKLANDPTITTAVINPSTTSSWLPNDPYFSAPASGLPQYYQWGMYAMNFPGAWDRVRGHAQVGLLEPGYPGTPVYTNGVVTSIAPHPDVAWNYRPQFAPGQPKPGTNWLAFNGHATHVAGIIAAQANKGNYTSPSSPTGGTAGGCPGCSLTDFSWQSTEVPDVGSGITRAIDTGMQVLNWSGNMGGSPISCATNAYPICTALWYAVERDVLLVESVGNSMKTQVNLPSPLNVAPDFFPNLLPVGGTDSTGARWVYDAANGSNEATLDGVMAPALSIVSSMPSGMVHPTDTFIKCGDAVGFDDSIGRYSNGAGDGVGTCTGTSMSAPHVSALAGLIRSINPRLPVGSVRNLITQNSSRATQRTVVQGYGVPNAWASVNAALATNPNRLTPLFALYSVDRSDSFYTTTPQMANAALDGSLMPRNASYGGFGTYGSNYGTGLTGYDAFPRSPFVIGGSGNKTPLAQVWLFTTDENPKDVNIALEPLYRMSWKCSDPTPYPPAICAWLPSHIDTVLITQQELSYFQSLGYQKDGIEGYVYPAYATQPPGTVRLMRKYNADRDDHAIFPESALPSMQAQGYIYDTGNNWLGYVYPNTNGQVPVIQ